ncbi:MULTISPECIES: Mpo1 family 2-hydroxy fatty acid dioxygenase [Alteromonas]|jgi:uncharacterized membrane protein YGL010W|uniref:Membrane protein n=1 Tax=Alteromonas mediterranea (strain DSM 17117 / CIP 110805 / LMG 28347 / Deep ecotype) TaxID=1774373 RepID=T2DLP7_ALTMD|nr:MULTISPECIES: Mpo1-like protein [Alteromonas]AGP94450.1 hypothetical protein I634_13775 [Alteromonas mediterranea U8]AGP86494.1 hypothetical protein I607_13545 [Alteromonas mediterranea U4]AGP90633.1 hypothetical protein I876_13930 [Alteromonas mediterranea U7]AGV53819.1 membrane protein [Alteromonas mediterranea DE]NQY17710.1 DUF962 domain-containing protein [Alteromonas sp.]|tara:strand:+ start:140 stop:655 length:516 start_codon:yes stop_codon:yes gene_type:complete
MKNLEQHLSEYAKHHRDQRNIYTHYIGIPLIVYSVFCLLSKPAIAVHLPLIGTINASPALFVWLISSAFYIKLDVKLGLIMALITGAMVYFAQPIAQYGVGTWLAISLSIFVVGWILQFIGHHYEGKKPAFVDDIMGLAIGPLFVLAELSFELGFRNTLKEEIERRSGPIR